jgi:hypothetical protein
MMNVLQKIGKWEDYPGVSWLIAGLLVLPGCVAFLILLPALWHMDALEMQFEELKIEAGRMYPHKAAKALFLSKHTNADPLYLSHQIARSFFLEGERNHIEALLHHPAPTQEPSLLSARLAHLSKDNALIFVEHSVRATDRIKETEEKQKQEVELDDRDLQDLFSILEGPPPDEGGAKPQVIVEDLILTRGEGVLQNPLWKMQMHLTKREFFR